MHATTLSPAGGFRRHGRPFIPLGANYWPGSCGVEMLDVWPADEIQRDLDLAAGLGLNCIRFFARWDQCLTSPGEVNHLALERIGLLVDWCAERGILAHPCLFVGFMSGAQYRPAWTQGRNLFADPTLLEEAVLLADAAAGHLAHRSDALLAIDLGNEPSMIPDAAVAGPLATGAWTTRLAELLRQRLGGVPICVGNDHSQVVGDRGWTFDAQGSCDFLSMHGYPAPHWHPLLTDGMTDPLAGELLPCYTACARAHGPVLVQEFGTLLGNGPGPMRTWLERTLDGCRSAGAAGFLWWCLRDIRSNKPPYNCGAMEQRLGILDDAGRPRPGTEPFFERLRLWTAAPADPPLPDGDVAIYWPAARDRRDPNRQVGNSPEDLGRRLLACWGSLRAAGRRPMIARHDRPLPQLPLINPGAAVLASEARTLSQWVQEGGHLLWNGVDPSGLGYDQEELLGTRPMDFRLPRPVTFPTAAGPIRSGSHLRGTALALEEPAEGSVLVRDDRGLPAAALVPRGKGRVLWTTPLIDEVATDPTARPGLAAWYDDALRSLAEGPASRA